jgi:hypothetical protein
MCFSATIICPPGRAAAAVDEEELLPLPVFSVQVKAMTAAANAQHSTTRLKGARGTPPSHSFQGTLSVSLLQAEAALVMLLLLLLLTQSGTSNAL